MSRLRVLRNAQGLIDDKARFLSHVVQGPGCWLWTGARTPRGYGQFRFRGCTIQAHRFSWMLFKSEDPAESGVLHHCDNPPCVNPDHLFLGDQVDNSRDMLSKGRHPHAKLSRGAPLEIRRLYAEGGYTQAQLGAMFGVSGPRISAIVRGKGRALV